MVSFPDQRLLTCWVSEQTCFKYADHVSIRVVLLFIQNLADEKLLIAFRNQLVEEHLGPESHQF